MAKFKPRDSQRQRLYTAQALSGLHGGGNDMSIKEAQKFVNKVLSHQGTKKLYEKYMFTFDNYPAEIIVESGSGNHATMRHRDWSLVRLIRLNTHGRNKFIILHEIAHHLVWGREAHGPEFADTLISLTSKYIGKEESQKLKDAFAEKRVKVMTKSGKARVPRRREIQSARIVA
jgi:putative metallohydrolase (TIGR04338 family)